MTRLCWSLLCLLVLDSAFGGTTTRKPDEICKNADMFGLIEIGCWGYKECVNGVYIEYLCPDNEVLVKETRQCHKRGNGNGVCDLPPDTECTNKPDAMYSELSDNCKSYYRCYGEINIGQFYCAGNLVFNDAIQSCDFLSNVPPPCGTKRPDTTTVPPTAIV